jgi:hypothetical protein
VRVTVCSECTGQSASLEPLRYPAVTVADYCREAQHILSGNCNRSTNMGCFLTKASAMGNVSLVCVGLAALACRHPAGG